MYITNNHLNVNFYVPKVYSKPTNRARYNVMLSYMNCFIRIPYGYNWLMVSFHKSLPKKHSKKRTVWLDADGNVVDNSFI